MALIHGDDDFAGTRRARQIVRKWGQPAAETEQEVLDAGAVNSGEALRALARLREALQTLPFFGSKKVVWFRDCNFLGDERTASAAAVTEALAELAQTLKVFRWEGVRLVISAAKVDKRRVLYKTLDAIGQVEEHAERAFDRGQGLGGSGGAICTAGGGDTRKAHHNRRARGPDRRGGPAVAPTQYRSREVVPLRGGPTRNHKSGRFALVSRIKHARAFASGEALGERNLPRALQSLDGPLGNPTQGGSEQKPYRLAVRAHLKVRTLLLLKELIRLGYLKTQVDYSRLKGLLARIPPEPYPPTSVITPRRCTHSSCRKPSPTRSVTRLRDRSGDESPARVQLALGG